MLFSKCHSEFRTGNRKDEVENENFESPIFWKIFHRFSCRLTRRLFRSEKVILSFSPNFPRSIRSFNFTGQNLIETTLTFLRLESRLKPNVILKFSFRILKMKISNFLVTPFWFILRKRRSCRRFCHI